MTTNKPKPERTATPAELAEESRRATRRPTAAELMTGKARPRTTAPAQPAPRTARRAKPAPAAAEPEIRTGGSDLPKPNPYLEADRRNAPSRPKPTRVTLDLSADDYEALNRYVAELTPEFHRLTIARVLRAMIRAAPGDYKVTAAITAQLRKEHPER